MWIIEIIMEHKLLFGTIAILLMLNVAYLVYLIIKDRKQDEEEIEKLTAERVDSNEEEQVVDEKVASSKTDLEVMLEKMQQDINAKPEEVVQTFENEQEEKSIISYQELVKSLKTEKPIYVETKEELTKTLNNKKDVIEIEENEKPEPIKIEIGDVTKVAIPEIKKKKTEFKSEDFISPIFGKQNTISDYPVVKEFKHKMIEPLENIDSITDDDYNIDYIFNNDAIINNKNTLEETLDLKPLNEEIKKNDEFLAALKEFRKNLQ